MVFPRRVLYIAYSLLPISDATCGGAEQALLTLESQMSARGYSTLVAACEDSRVTGELLATGALRSGADEFELRDAEHIENILNFMAGPRGTQVDLIHDHGGSFWRHAGLVDIPVLATLHLPRKFYPSATFQDLPENLTVNCVSESQAASFRDVEQLAGVVRNGIDVERFPFNADKEDYLLWLGRICPEKGTHVALDVAQQAGLRIVVAGQVYPFSFHQHYYQDEVAPRLDAMRGSAVLVGDITFEEKLTLLRSARAVLIPSLVDETSSLVAMEAMACGTPVVCLRCGALPEVVADGLTGFVVDSAEEIVQAIRQADSISPHDCRQRVEQLFTATRVADEYELLYRKVIARTRSMALAQAS